MATTTTVSSNYNGKENPDFFLRAFREEDTLRLGLIDVVTDINYKLHLKKIETSLGTVDYTCGFNPQGSVTLSEKELVTKKFKNDIQVCKEDFRPTWGDGNMGASAHNDQDPRAILDAITADLMAQQAAKVENDIWQGTDVTGSFPGFVTQFEADGDVIKANNGIVPIGAAITEANVESELKKVLNAVPVALRRRDLQVIVSPDVFQAYWFYLVSKGIANDGNAEPKQVRFGRYTITEVNGLDDNTIIVYQKGNLVMATGLTTDITRLDLGDEIIGDGVYSGNVVGTMVYNAAVGYNDGSEIVYYKSTTTPA